MIIRILGEGQFELADDVLDVLNSHDAKVAAAIEANDEEALATSLEGLLALVREGRQLADDELVDSDLIVPDASATLDEVRAILDENQDGLIPG